MDNLLKQAKVRPWNEFFEISRFGLPDTQNLDGVSDRVEANLDYYFGNYVILCLVICLYAFITTPALLISAFVIVGVGVYVFYVRQTPLRVNGTQLTFTQQVLGFCGASVLFLWITSGSAALLYFSLMWLAVFGHALIRKRSIKAKLNVASGTVTGNSVTNSLAKVAEKIVDVSTHGTYMV